MTLLDTWPLRPATAGSLHPSVGVALAAKGDATIATIIPARDEGATIADVVSKCRSLIDAGLVDEVLVVDDGSSDPTAGLAKDAGATVVINDGGTGKGQALRCGVANTAADVLVFLDADVANFEPWFVSALVIPLLESPHLELIKASYRRPFDGRPGEGGRVTEILARPLLERFFPDLASVEQPLAGESAVRRRTLGDVQLADGYGIEIGLLIDIRHRYGRNAIAQVDLGERVHRNRPLHDLHSHSRQVLDAVLSRALPVTATLDGNP